MKVQTNAGDVELTAEMVCRGMVLRSRDGEVVTLLEGSAGLWSVKEWTRGGLTPPLADCWQACLGCNPAIASRANCERFGVHGDAGAHGFARLRGGGAVDLRRAAPPAGSVVVLSNGQRVTLAYQADACFGGGQRFIGLDLNHANPEDVRRLCCGQSHDPGSSIFCTLAIGDHDTHEDLATGVRWAAEKALFTPFAEAVLGLDVPEHHKQMASAEQDRLRANAKVVPTAEGFTITAKWTSTTGLRPDLYPNRLALATAINGGGGGLYVPKASIKAGGTGYRFGNPASGMRWTGADHVVPGLGFLDCGTDTRVTIRPDEFRCSCGATSPEHVEACKAPFWFREASSAAWAAMPQGMDAATEHGRAAMIGASALGLFVWLRRLWEASPEGFLAARDAAVAKAIADVPEGCDVKRWANVVRVLAAFHEETARTLGRAQATSDMVRHIAAARPVVTAYARLRFVAGYGVGEALARLPAEVVTTDTAARICAAYEAGR